MARGALIVLEGCDRCGKSTQAQLLLSRLAGTATLLKFPDRTTTIGAMINAYLTSTASIDDRSIHLLFSANRWEAVKDMKRQLAAGTTLIVDRYAYSGVAFSAAKGLDLSWCQQPDVGLPKPDLVLYMDMSVDDAAKRGGYGEERYEKVAFQRQVRQLFLDRLRDPSWKIMDATKSIEELEREIGELVDQTIKRVADTPLGTLWT
ncbi:hypothetical protein RI367_002844 [Sorochytrium milnesiophthora]